MAVLINSGFVKGDPSSVVLFHGGAGPQDPKGDKFTESQLELEKIVNKIFKQDSFKFDINSEIEKRVNSSSESVKKVISVVTELENHPNFNAGLGAALQSDQVARVSAGFMESKERKFSAVINVKEVMNPSLLAFYLQFERYCVLDSMGSENLSRQLGFPEQNLVTEERIKKLLKQKEKEERGKSGTVGGIAIVKNKKTGKLDLAACTSTGGVGNETPGRVSDTPTVSANYCSNFSAISCTGIGEQIRNLGVSVKIDQMVSMGISLKDAVAEVLKEALSRTYEFGLIALAYDAKYKKISWCVGRTTASMLAYGRTSEDEVFRGIDGSRSDTHIASRTLNVTGGPNEREKAPITRRYQAGV